MKKTISFIAFAAAIVLSNVVIADTVSLASVVIGNGTTAVTGSSYDNFYIRGELFHNEDGSTSLPYAGPLAAESLSQGFTMPKNFFCGDNLTSTNDAYHTAEGQAYQVFHFTDLYSGEVAGMVQNLFDHAYDSIYNVADGTYALANAAAFQLALWEVIHEDLSLNGFNVSNGDFYVSEYYLEGAASIALANEWLASLVSSEWGENYATSTAHDLFAFASVDADGNVNRNISQTFIGADVFPTPTPSATPEPGTMLIFGIGMAGAALARRRMKKA